jgi:hypothetical protein
MHTSRNVALAILSICLVMGGAVHLFDIASGGIFPYRFAPLPVNVYWTSLAALDLLAAFLLWRQRRLGLALTVTIMLSDVVVNSFVTYVLKLSASFAPLQLQTLFLGFVLGCVSFLWQNDEHFQPLATR